MSKDSTAVELPLIASDLAKHESGHWGVPVIIAGRLANSDGEITLLPKFKAGQTPPCPRLADCTRAVAHKAWKLEKQGRLDGQWPIVSHRRDCPGNRTFMMVAVPFRFSEKGQCVLVFGCLPEQFERAALSRPEQERPETTGAIAACRTDPERKAILGAFVERGRLAAKVLRCAASADAYEAQAYGLWHGFRRFFDDPENDQTSCEALSGFEQIKAVAHLEVCCDGAGGGYVQLKWFAGRAGDKLVKLSRSGLKRFTRPVPIAGAVLERWHRCLPSFTFDIASLPTALRLPKERTSARPADPLVWYHRGFHRYTSGCRLVMIGRLGVNVARGSCDKEPQCEFKSSCRLMLNECFQIEKAKCSACPIRLQCRLHEPGKPIPKGWPGPWRRRMAAVDLLFMEGFPESRPAQAAIIQAASMVNHERLVQQQLEESLLRGLPRLPKREQRTILRRLFDRCRAIEDAQRKGAAFEQLANGLLRLVPGWIPSRRNLRTIGAQPGDFGNELDFAVFVEPAVPAAQYWFSIFGPKILIECKNYPGGLPLRLGRKKENPVIKLYRVMERTRTKLALLLNTGRIDDSLRQEAQRMAKPNRLVVLFEGADLERLIDSPGDVEEFLKQQVSDAAICASYGAPTGRRSVRSTQRGP